MLEFRPWPRARKKDSNEKRLFSCPFVILAAVLDGDPTLLRDSAESPEAAHSCGDPSRFRYLYWPWRFGILRSSKIA